MNPRWEKRDGTKAATLDQFFWIPMHETPEIEVTIRTVVYKIVQFLEMVSNTIRPAAILANLPKYPQVKDYLPLWKLRSP